MSHLHALPAAFSTASAALRRNRSLPPSCPEVDAPHTAAALAEASSLWQQSADSYAADSAGCWEDAARFVDQVANADDTLAREWA